MQCTVCEMPLEAEDNYCRTCGEAVQVVQVPAVRPAAPPAILRAAAVPIAGGAAAVAVTVLARWALGQALRGIFSAPSPRRGRVAGAASPSAGGFSETVEFVWYRRTRGG